MADFAPTYTDAYDKDQSEVITLVALTLSANEFEEGSTADTEIGDLTGVSSGSVLSILMPGPTSDWMATLSSSARPVVIWLSATTRSSLSRTTPMRPIPRVRRN